MNYYYNGKHYPSQWLAWSAGVSDGLTMQQAQDQTKATLGHDVDTFDNYDWTVEPTESWDEICKQRAQQIRDEYDYIAISYGGGSDCHHILETFLRNNIKFDEIIINVDSLMRDSNYINYEQRVWASETCKLLPSHVKITTITHSTLDIFLNQFSEDMLLNRGGKLVPDTLGICQRIWKPIGGNSVVVNGSWEPVIHKDYRNKFYIHLWDTDGFGTAFSMPGTIPFYTDPEFPAVHAKQCHILKNFFKEHKNFLDYSKDYEYYKDTIIRLTRNAERLSLYKKSPFYVKIKNTEKGHNHDFVQHPKSRAFYASLGTHEPKTFEKFHAIVNEKYLGIPLIRHQKGVEIGKYYLE